MGNPVESHLAATVRRAQPPRTNLEKLWLAAPTVPRSILLPPWRYIPRERGWPDKDTQKQRVEERLAGEHSRALQVFTDGSGGKRGEAGWAATAWKEGKEVEVRRGKLAEAEVFDAELWAVAEGVKMACEHFDRNGGPAVVFSDSQAAVLAALKGNTKSSQLRARMVRVALDNVREGSLVVDWCPAHVGVHGNERADRLTKEATGREWEPKGSLTVARARRLARERHEQRLREWWETSRPARYGKLGLDHRPDALGTTRKRMAGIVFHRTAHGPFVSYLRRFGKNGVPLHGCGTPRETQHISYCKSLAAHRNGVLETARKRKAKLSTEGLYRWMVGREATRFFPPEDCF